MGYVFLLFKGGRKLSKNQSEVSDIASVLEICSANGEGLTLEPSALKIFPEYKFTLLT